MIVSGDGRYLAFQSRRLAAGAAGSQPVPKANNSGYACANRHYR
ncbi:hypothetical protein [Kamptonema formosum]|nr:hypothetical protein [Oscillatoria sp. PCC 10802]